MIVVSKDPFNFNIEDYTKDIPEKYIYNGYIDIRHYYMDMFKDSLTNQEKSDQELSLDLGHSS